MAPIQCQSGKASLSLSQGHYLRPRLQARLLRMVSRRMLMSQKGKADTRVEAGLSETGRHSLWPLLRSVAPYMEAVAEVLEARF